MTSIYQHASFILSALDLRSTPPDEGFEVAFAGRSNAGKSSAINTITSQKTLARTSKTPGRTQQLIFIKLDDERRLVDLPGYGYAKVSAVTKRNIQNAVDAYLGARKSLRGVFILVDIRHPLTDFDQQMIQYCEDRNIPFHIALTKADKFRRGRAKTTLLMVKRQMAQVRVPWSVQLFSALKQIGVEEAHKILDHWLAIHDDGVI